jgi:hypothetical protein
MVHLPERASEGCVSVFYVKATREINIPIFIPFVYVGEISIVHLLHPSLSKQKLHVVPTERDNVAGHCCHGP